MSMRMRMPTLTPTIFLNAVSERLVDRYLPGCKLYRVSGSPISVLGMMKSRPMARQVWGNSEGEDVNVKYDLEKGWGAKGGCCFDPCV